MFSHLHDVAVDESVYFEWRKFAEKERGHGVALHSVKDYIAWLEENSHPEAP